jgi:hypothetical protein
VCFEVMCERGVSVKAGCVHEASRGGAGQVTAVCVHLYHLCCADRPSTHTGEAGLSMVFHSGRCGGGAALLITARW